MGKRKRKKKFVKPDKSSKRITALVVAILATLTIAMGIFAFNQKMQIDQLEKKLNACRAKCE